MLARKCDRCGRLYEKSEKMIDENKTDTIITASRNDFHNDYHENRKTYDLCQDCLESFDRWFKTISTEKKVTNEKV